MSYGFNGKRVYLSGPMSELPDHNEPAFAEAKRLCINAGVEVCFNPCSAWGHHDRPRPWYMCHDLHHLTAMDGERPYFDAIVLLDGWHASDGSQLEYKVARECGIAQVNIRELMAHDLR